MQGVPQVDEDGSSSSGMGTSVERIDVMREVVVRVGARSFRTACAAPATGRVMSARVRDAPFRPGGSDTRRRAWL